MALALGLWPWPWPWPRVFWPSCRWSTLQHGCIRWHLANRNDSWQLHNAVIARSVWLKMFACFIVVQRVDTRRSMQRVFQWYSKTRFVQPGSPCCYSPRSRLLRDPLRGAMVLLLQQFLPRTSPLKVSLTIRAFYCSANAIFGKVGRFASEEVVFTVRRYALHGLSYHNSVHPSVRPSVCLSVFLSHSCTVSTWFDLRSWFLHHMVAPSF